jgi:hypothetical protein
MSKQIVLNVNDWNTPEVKYMAPKVNDKGGKSVTIISKQTNRSLNITTPLQMTWGISDFVDEKTGESDGKYSISLVFPNDDYKNEATDAFLQKLKDFENQILDDAVKHSELWFGDSLNREVIKHMFFPILKYSKNKETKKIDYSRPPTIRAKVPNYGGKWGVEIYDTQANLIFPCDNPNMTPMDFVPKMSSVACVLGFSQLWVGGKGFGVQLKLIQCVVKPRLVESVYGKCHISLSSDEKKQIEAQKIPEVAEALDEEELSGDHGLAAASTAVEDSDDDEPKVAATSAPAPVPTQEAMPEEQPVVAAAADASSHAGDATVVKKRVVKKKA